MNIENCCAIITRPLYCRVCKCKASFQRRQFRVTIDLGAAISIYSDASLFPGVPYLKSVAPIDLTGVTGDSMRCKGSILAPWTLSIDGFTNCKSDAYGTFTVQSGFTGKQGGSDKCQETLGLNTFRTNLTINFQGAHFLRLDLRLKLLAWINCSTV